MQRDSDRPSVFEGLPETLRFYRKGEQGEGGVRVAGGYVPSRVSHLVSQAVVRMTIVSVLVLHGGFRKSQSLAGAICFP